MVVRRVHLSSSTLQYSVLSQKSGENMAEDLLEYTGVSITTASSQLLELCLTEEKEVRKVGEENWESDNEKN